MTATILPFRPRESVDAVFAAAARDGFVPSPQLLAAMATIRELSQQYREAKQRAVVLAFWPDGDDRDPSAA